MKLMVPDCPDKFCKLYINQAMNINETTTPNIIIIILVSIERLLDAKLLSNDSGNMLTTRPVAQMIHMSSATTITEINMDLLFASPPGKLNTPIKKIMRNMTKDMLPYTENLLKLFSKLVFDVAASPVVLSGIVSIKIRKMREKEANKIASKTENPKYF
jgi:hypothetical protein